MIAGLEPMEGARDFLDALRDRTQVIILSDTFEQFGAPLMRQLGMPTILCHQLDRAATTASSTTRCACPTRSVTRSRRSAA